MTEIPSVYYRSVSEIPQGDEVEARERALVTAPEVSWALREVNRLASEVDVELARRLHLRLLDTTALAHVMTSAGALGPAELSARLGIPIDQIKEAIDEVHSEQVAKKGVLKLLDRAGCMGPSTPDARG